MIQGLRLFLPSTLWKNATRNRPSRSQSTRRDNTGTRGRTVGSIVLSIVALSGSFVAAIILTILATRKIEPPNTETNEAEA